MGDERPHVVDLPKLWRREAAELAKYGADGPARALTTAAAELEAALREDGAETLSLTEAATVSGYSADHLGRLIRGGALVNAGTARRPRIRRADLPRRAPPVAPKRPVLYDVDADARDLTARRR